MEKILAIDYGTKRVGLAIGEFGLARPLQIVPHTPALFSTLKEILEQENITSILVGMSENKMAEQTQNFIEQLRQQVSLPIEVTDETLSSQQVHQKLATGPMRRNQRQQPIDHFAAAEFLQEWLDTN